MSIYHVFLFSPMQFMNFKHFLWCSFYLNNKSLYLSTPLTLYTFVICIHILFQREPSSVHTYCYAICMLITRDIYYYQFIDMLLFEEGTLINTHTYLL